LRKEAAMSSALMVSSAMSGVFLWFLLCVRTK
jgi:hypothetical protein